MATRPKRWTGQATAGSGFRVAAAHRDGALTAARQRQPAQYLRLAAALLPQLSTESTLDNVSDEEFAAAVAILRELDDKKG
jgi:hypothetical protein